MKKIFSRIIGFSCVIFCMISGVAFSSDEGTKGTYVSGNLGVVLMEDSDMSDPTGSVTVELSPGWSLGVAAGHDWGNIRAEWAIEYQKNHIDKVNLGATTLDASGNINNLAFLVNGYYDFENSSRFTPYLSAGIGFAKVKLSDFAVLGMTDDNSDDNVLVYQAGIGIAYSIDKNLIIDLKYRYFCTEDPEFDTVSAEVASHNIYLGLRYTF